MTPEIITYLTFGGLLIVALIFDLGLLSKKHSHITIRKALWQTIFWVSLALAFFVFVWIEFDRTIDLGPSFGENTFITRSASDTTIILLGGDDEING